LGYACQVNGCSASAGVTYSETCAISSYLCPSSVGYGCCSNGFACGVSQCYATSISTFILTETLTTTDARHLPHTVTSTVTSTSTPTVPTNLATNAAPSGVLPKITPTAAEVSKTSPTSPANTSSSSGLSKAQLGGVIGGAVLLLAVLIIATVLIIRRLNKVVKASTATQSRTRTLSNGYHSRPNLRSIPSDLISVDPLIVTPSEASRSVRHSHQSRSCAHEVEGSSRSPPISGSPFPPRSPASTHYPRGYNAVPSSDSPSCSGHGRNVSLESTPPMAYHPNASYFDIPPKPDLRDQNLRFGHSPVSPPQRPSHGRNWSDASDQSEVSQGSSSLAELDAGPDGDRRSSLQRALQGFGMGRLSIRRKSSTTPSPTTLPGRPASRTPDWGPKASPGASGLGHIPEAGESRVTVDDTEMREISLGQQQAFYGMSDHRYG